jgi:hypothetical protein
MSAETLPLIDWESVRKGDIIRSTSGGVTREGVADFLVREEPEVGDAGWHTREGEWIAGLTQPIFLVSRPEPEVKPGTTGTATVRGEDGVRVMRLRSEFPDDLAWCSALPVGGWRNHLEDQVTDFVPDPEPLTAEAVEDLIEIAGVATDLDQIRQALAPYVAGGAR